MEDRQREDGQVILLIDRQREDGQVIPLCQPAYAGGFKKKGQAFVFLELLK